MPDLVDAEGNTVSEVSRSEARRRVYTMAIENIQYVLARARAESRIDADRGMQISGGA